MAGWTHSEVSSRRARIRKDGLSYWVEAVPVVEGLDLADDVFELGPGSGLSKPPFEWALLSRTAALREKDAKGVASRLTGVIGVADSYPVAVDGGQLSQVTMPHGASRLPLAVKAAFPVGPLLFASPRWPLERDERSEFEPCQAGGGAALLAGEVQHGGPVCRPVLRLPKPTAVYAGRLWGGAEMVRRSFIVAVFLVACAPERQAFAWGAEGHRIVALIAQGYLQTGVRDRIAKILADDTDNTVTAHDMAEESVWADRIREENVDGAKRGTSQWHYVDIEIAHPDVDAACFGHPMLPAGQLAYPGVPKDCVLDKLGQFQKELGRMKTPDAERLVALKFVLHFAGDLHQPLHAADDDDRGGNAKKVKTVEGRSENLHAFWDVAVVQRLGRDPAAVANDLAGKITMDERSAWARGTPTEWAMETFGVGKSDAYGRLPPAGADGIYQLTDAYETMAARDAARQLSKAGVRLAELLNSALGTTSAE